MLKKIKDILKIKIPFYVVILAVIMIFTPYFYFIIHESNKHLQKYLWMKRKGECYWTNGNIKEEGYYDKGRKIGKWYYYNKNGCLSFIDDMDSINKKYVVDSRFHGSFPRDISYILRNSEKDIIAQEGYWFDGSLDYLYIDIPSKNIYITVLYDQYRHITDVKYNIKESGRSDSLKKSKKK